MKKIRIPLENRSYDIIIGTSILDGGNTEVEEVASLIKKRTCLIVTDTNVGRLYLDAVANAIRKSGAGSVVTCTFPAGEPSKCLDTVKWLYTRAVEARLDRKSLVIALGGGVVGDTAGFLAATFMRGIGYIQIPTSLVALVDSSVGGKTGVDLPEGKNLVGAFHQPLAVIADTGTLATLPDRELRCGLAEVVKYGVILDASFFAYLEANAARLADPAADVYPVIVNRCCEIKAEIVRADEFDHGTRALLNYGHTFGHALETLSGYGRFTHGEAIAIGMSMAAEVANRRTPCTTATELMSRQDALFEAIGLPTRVRGFSPQEILVAMQTDKKNEGGRIRLILASQLGAAGIADDVPETMIIDAVGARCD